MKPKRCGILSQITQNLKYIRSDINVPLLCYKLNDFYLEIIKHCLGTHVYKNSPTPTAQSICGLPSIVSQLHVFESSFEMSG